MTNQEAAKILGQYDVSDIHFYTTDGKEIPFDKWSDAIEMAIKALEAQEWIPVTKKSHPDTPERVQVQLDNGWIITAYYEENEWLSVPDCGGPIQDRWIEAWRPLPELYRGDKDETD